MIVTFPALCSTTIDRNILPGIAKALELYAITYRLEDELKKETDKNIKINSKTKRLMMEVTEIGQNPKTGQPSVQTTSAQTTKGSGSNKVGVDKPWSQEISLAPTWVKIDTPYGAKIVGVKVIMFPVKSDKAFAEALGKDLNREGFFKNVGAFILKWFMRGLWKPWDSFVRKLGFGGIIGDPKHDVIRARTEYGNNVFCVYDMSNLKTSINNPKTMRKIFKQYWTSMIFCDDANNVAHFCMEKFTGICNAIPYRMLYTMSRQSDKVYNDLTETSSASSSIFKRKKEHLSKIFGESYAASKVLKYVNLLNEKEV